MQTATIRSVKVFRNRRLSVHGNAAHRRIWSTTLSQCERDRHSSQCDPRDRNDEPHISVVSSSTSSVSISVSITSGGEAALADTLGADAKSDMRHDVSDIFLGCK